MYVKFLHKENYVLCEVVICPVKSMKINMGTIVCQTSTQKSYVDNGMKTNDGSGTLFLGQMHCTYII